MDISKIPTGANPPKDINVLIEIPLGGVPVKYEIDKASGALFVDQTDAHVHVTTDDLVVTAPLTNSVKGTRKRRSIILPGTANDRPARNPFQTRRGSVC